MDCDSLCKKDMSRIRFISADAMQEYFDNCVQKCEETQTEL